MSFVVGSGCLSLSSGDNIENAALAQARLPKLLRTSTFAYPTSVELSGSTKPAARVIVDFVPSKGLWAQTASSKALTLIPCPVRISAARGESQPTERTWPLTFVSFASFSLSGGLYSGFVRASAQLARFAS